MFLLGVSVIANIVFFTKTKANSSIAPVTTDFAEDQKKFPLLAKRILIDHPNDVLINFLLLRKNLRETVKDWDDTFGFYFEYLPTGSSIGINDKVANIEASLVKTPLVMALYRKIERKQHDFTDETVVIEKRHLDSDFGELWKQGVGAKITLDEAVSSVLVESDNTAFNIIKDYVAPEDFEYVYEGLDIDVTKAQGELTVSAKNYSSVFKALYFSSVINKEHSEKILELLSKTRFTDKLPAGVPKDIVVAHKIGQFYNSIYQDCGIVFVPNRPYLLCMFSKSNEDEARDRMVKVSKTVYDYVSKANK